MRLGWQERADQSKTWRKNIWCIRKNKYKGPEAETSSACLRNSRKGSIGSVYWNEGKSGTKWGQRCGQGLELRTLNSVPVGWATLELCRLRKEFGFYYKSNGSHWWVLWRGITQFSIDLFKELHLQYKEWIVRGKTRDRNTNCKLLEKSRQEMMVT